MENYGTQTEVSMNSRTDKPQRTGTIDRISRFIRKDINAVFLSLAVHGAVLGYGYYKWEQRDIRSAHTHVSVKQDPSVTQEKILLEKYRRLYPSLVHMHDREALAVIEIYEQQKKDVEERKKMRAGSPMQVYALQKEFEQRTLNGEQIPYVEFFRKHEQTVMGIDETVLDKGETYFQSKIAELKSTVYDSEILELKDFVSKLLVVQNAENADVTRTSAYECLASRADGNDGRELCNCVSKAKITLMGLQQLFPEANFLMHKKDQHIKVIMMGKQGTYSVDSFGAFQYDLVVEDTFPPSLYMDSFIDDATTVGVDDKGVDEGVIPIVNDDDGFEKVLPAGQIGYVTPSQIYPDLQKKMAELSEREQRQVISGDRNMELSLLKPIKYGEDEMRDMTNISESMESMESGRYSLRGFENMSLKVTFPDSEFAGQLERIVASRQPMYVKFPYLAPTLDFEFGDVSLWDQELLKRVLQIGSFYGGGVAVSFNGLPNNLLDALEKYAISENVIVGIYFASQSVSREKIMQLFSKSHSVILANMPGLDIDQEMVDAVASNQKANGFKIIFYKGKTVFIRTNGTVVDLSDVTDLNKKTISLEPITIPGTKK